MPRKPRVLTLYGKAHTINEWSERTGIPVETIRTRIDVLGKTEAEALTTPVDPRFRRSTGRPSADRPRPCPGLKRHASGQAYVRWKAGGVPFYRYFGDWGSEDAKAGYRRFQVEWADGLATVRTAGHGGATVAELCVAYLKHAERYYQKNGRRTSEVHIVKSAIRELVGWLPDKLIGDVRAGDIDGLRSDLARRKLARATVNKYIGRIQRLFDWGAGQTAQSGRPLVPADVLVSVKAVKGLRAGRSSAREPDNKRAVPWADVEATFPHLNRQPDRRAVLEDLIRAHWHTGMRSGEILAMRPCDLDRSRGEWKYTVPGGGKTTHLGTVGVYWIGPKAQKIISPHLDGCPADRPVFALPPRASKGRGWGRWIKITRDAYRRLVTLACRKAKVPHWHPHQIRHARATEVQRIYESDRAAAAAIGTSEEVARAVYADPSEDVRRRIARETG